MEKEFIIPIIGAVLLGFIGFGIGRITSQSSEKIVECERPAPQKSKIQLIENGDILSVKKEGEFTLKLNDNISNEPEINKSAPTTITAYNDFFEFSSPIVLSETCTNAEEKSTTTPSSPNTIKTGQYVASKNGEKYHPADSGTAKRIKVENKIYFDSKEEAEAAGYEPGQSVK